MALLAGRTELLALGLRHPLDALASLPPYRRQRVLDARRKAVDSEKQESRGALPLRDSARDQSGELRTDRPIESAGDLLQRLLTPPERPWVL